MRAQILHLLDHLVTASVIGPEAGDASDSSPDALEARTTRPRVNPVARCPILRRICGSTSAGQILQTGSSGSHPRSHRNRLSPCFTCNQIARPELLSGADLLVQPAIAGMS